jgi:hypothetical protein
MNVIVGVAGVAIDCTTDPVEQARWWQGLLGGEVVIDDEGYATLLAEGSPCLDFLPVPEAKTVKNRLHLDLRPTDYDEAVTAALAHGATRADDVYDGTRWAALRDPFGNEFCILRPRNG